MVLEALCNLLEVELPQLQEHLVQLRQDPPQPPEPMGLQQRWPRREFTEEEERVNSRCSAGKAGA